MFVCICRALTESEFLRALAEGESAAQIMAKTGAGSRCGKCRDRLARMSRGQALMPDNRGSDDTAG
jgi:bacterioferritin-associated ferredoxin